MGLLDDVVGGAEHLVSGAEHVAGKVIDDGSHVVSDGLNAVGLHGAANDVSQWGDDMADRLGDAVPEKQLGETNDPTALIHGDVGALNDTIDKLGTFATGFAETAHGLSAVDSAHWQGQAADAFRAKYSPQPKKWEDAYQACNGAADALSSYSQTVHWAQGQAALAINLYNKGQQATATAKTAYQHEVDNYNNAADSYNQAVSAGQDPGSPPTQPAAFTDPGAADRQQAQSMLDHARQQRDSSGAQAASAVAKMTDLAPAEPSLGRRLLDDAGDMFQGTMVAAEDFTGGIVKGAAGIVDFARSLDPLDPYNITHPAEYIDGLSSTAAGLVHMAMHPTDIVQSLVGTGWGSDPFEAAGKLVPNIALALATDGAGAADDAGASAAEDAGARDLAGAAEDSATSPDATICEDDPVDVVTGGVLLRQVDVELPGLLPLVVERTHRSNHRLGRWFGRSWASTLDQRVIVDEQGFLFVASDGVILHYPATDGPEVYPSHGARWPLVRKPDGNGYTVTDPVSGRTTHFTRKADEGTWLVTGISDRTGQRITVRYDEHGAPVELQHGSGYGVLIATENGRVTALRLAADDATATDTEDTELIRYAHTDGVLTEVGNSSGLAQRFDYDHAGRLLGWVDRNGVWYRYTYDGQGRCVRTESQDGALSGTFDYGDQVTVHTDGLGATTRYEYDDQRRIIAMTDALGNVTHTEYDEDGNVLTRTDPLGRSTRWEHDPAGNPIRVTRPDGTQGIAEYDTHHQPTLVVEPDGAVWRHAYDQHGHRIATTDPLGHTVAYSYDERGHIAALTDATGRTTTIETNLAGLPIMIIDPNGGTLRYRRDGFGRVTEQTDALGATTRYGWTIEGKLSWRTGPDGATERWTYDGEGNEIAHTDVLGHVTHTEYTHFDLRSATITPDGSRTEYRYDSRLRPVSVTNPQGLVWHYEYDLGGRLRAETDFNGRTVRYTHDAAGQLIERTNGVGATIGYEYDVLGNVVTEYAGAQRTRFEYDESGRLVHAVDGDCDLVLRRDAVGRVVAETVNGRTLSTTYDAAGRRLTRRTPAGVQSEWEYDAVGNRAALHSAGHTLAYAHDQAGREVERRLGESVTLAQTWHRNGQLAGQTLSGGTRTLQRRAYQYRADGALVEWDDQLAGNRRFELDPLGRVTAVVSAHGREQYRYDSAGNLTHAVWPSSASMPHTDAIGARSYTGTRVDRAGNIRYQHDGQGRIVMRQQRRLSTKDWIWRYAWDDSDRLVAVTTPDGSRWHYRYDPLGRRIAKQRLAPDGVNVVEQVDFTWDGTDMVEQAHNGNDTTTWDYADHQPLTQVERKSTQDWFDQRFYAIATDLIGSPTELVDEDGTVAWHHEATLWGAALDRVAGRAYTPLRFPGQYFDAETGLHYNHHRYYDPTTARYASQDPLGLLPAPNPVTYVPNPLGWIDRLGLMNCNIRVSSAFQDWGTKGAHVHIDGAEVRVYPDGQGGVGVEGIRLRNGNVPTPKQLAQVQNAIQTDPGLRADLIQKTRSVMDNMNAGTYGMAQNRAAEMNFLIKALEKMG